MSAKDEGVRSAAARVVAREPHGDGRERRAPRPSRRSSSRIVAGRTIAERREKLETASERTAARNKVKKRQRRRLIATIIGFIAAIAAVVVAINFFLKNRDNLDDLTTTATVSEITYKPTIEIIDEDATGTGVKTELTSRMKAYIGQAEYDFKSLGYTPVKAVIPTGAIREVDFYLDGQPGFIKLIIDRGTGVSTEDADRMLRYLAANGIETWQYIDVRLDGKAYWK